VDRVRQQLILEATTEGFWDWDLKEDRAYLSPRYCELIGYSPGDMVFNAEFLRMIVHPDDRQHVFQTIQELFQGPLQGRNIEYRIVSKNGTVRWVEARGRIVAHDERGRPSRMVGSIVDISDRKRMEQELRLSEERFRSLVESTSDCIWEIDAQGCFTYLSPKFRDNTGYPPEAFIGKTPFDLMFDEEREQLHGEFMAVVAEKKPFSFLRHHNRRRDGSLVVVEVSGVPLFGPEGQYLGMRGITRDITERKLVEERLYESRRQSEHLANILNLSSQPFAVGYPDGRIGLFNPAFERLTGYTRDELRSIDWARTLTPPEWRMVERRNLSELDRTGRPVRYEKEYIRKDGSRVPVELLVHLAPDADGKPEYYYAFLTDLTERKRAAEEKLALERQTLQALKLESLGIMAGGVAHDYNNLLQTIMGNMELVRKNLPPDSEPEKLIDSALVAGKRAAHLTGLLLNYVGSGLISRMKLDLNGIIRESSDMLAIAATQDVSLEQLLSAELPPIMADEAQLQQVVLHLVANAAESIGKRPGFIRIATGSIDCDQTALAASLIDAKPELGRFVFLDVSDNGCGMGEETVSRLFDPFYTTKCIGRGLGMSAVMGIVRKHGGAIFVKSKPGSGTTVRVLFPVSGTAPSARAQKTAIPPPETADLREPSLSGLALVVDDEKLVLKVCAKMVKLCGFTVITACDGIDAVNKFRERADEITVVLMDISMPNMDGVATMGEIYKIRPDARVILASGFSEEELDRRLTGQPPAGFVRKPFSMGALEAEMKRVMRQG